MAFTTSDTFDLVYIALPDTNPAQFRVSIRNTNGDTFYYNFGQGEHPIPESGTQEHTDWLIIQDTWALNNGFSDENGDAIAVYVRYSVLGVIIFR